MPQMKPQNHIKVNVYFGKNEKGELVRPKFDQDILVGAGNTCRATEQDPSNTAPDAQVLLESERIFKIDDFGQVLISRHGNKRDGGFSPVIPIWRDGADGQPELLGFTDAYQAKIRLWKILPYFKTRWQPTRRARELILAGL